MFFSVRYCFALFDLYQNAVVEKKDIKIIHNNKKNIMKSSSCRPKNGTRTIDFPLFKYYFLWRNPDKYTSYRVSQVEYKLANR